MNRKSELRKFFLFTPMIIFMLLLRLTAWSQSDGVILPEILPVSLKPYAEIQAPYINEASGLVKSKLWKNVFWTHNDSGDEARIFPINRQGELLKPEWMQNYVGIQIPDAVNVDWEAITTDDAGHLIIADIGNNSNTRRDLTIYYINEPYPWETVTTSIYKKIRFYYPEQKEIPSLVKNYDAEAVFWNDHYIYILTKHRSDSNTRLYRIDPSLEELEIPAEFLEEFNTQARVTGADMDSTGKKIAVLTETSLWLFERSVDSQKFFSGSVYWIPLELTQPEAVCFDGPYIIILNETGELYRIEQINLHLLK